MDKISFDHFGLNSSTEPGNPGHNSVLAGWQERAIRVGKPTNRSKGDEGLLSNTVGGVNAGHDAMP